MKISLNALLSAQPIIERLVLNSFGCAIYLVDVRVQSHTFRVVDEHGKPLVFRSQLAAKKPFKGLAVVETLLRHSSPYSEMIGLQSEVVEPMLVRLSNPVDDLS